MYIVLQGFGQFVALQAGGEQFLPVLSGAFRQLAGAIALHQWNARQQVAVAVAADLGQLLAGLIGAVLEFRILAFQAVRAHQPEVAVGAGQPLDVRFLQIGRVVARGSRQCEVVVQRELPVPAVAAGALVVVRQTGEPFQSERLVVRHPERVADLYRDRQPVPQRLALAQGMACRIELQRCHPSCAHGECPLSVQPASSTVADAVPGRARAPASGDPGMPVAGRLAQALLSRPGAGAGSEGAAGNEGSGATIGSDVEVPDSIAALVPRFSRVLCSQAL